MNKHYAVADLHGRYDLWKKIDEFTDSTDIIYVLGDCCDRGPDGWKLIKEIYNSPKTVYIKGNHEEMFADNIALFSSTHYLNGGRKTYIAWEADGADKSWRAKLIHLPEEVVYLNKNNQEIILTHAGYTPGMYGSYPDVLWNRKHFYEKWDEENYSRSYIIHGHTCLTYMDEYYYPAPLEEEFLANPKAYWYCADSCGRPHKCNIDCESAYTGMAILLDLDTFEEHLIKVEKNN